MMQIFFMCGYLKENYFDIKS
jgi:hypothetical protein